MKFRHVVILMMMISKTYLVGKGVEKKCYQCRTDQNPDCMEIKDDKYLKTCDKNSTTEEININSAACTKRTSYACRKTEQHLYFLENSPITILRECTLYVTKKYKDCFVVKSPSYFTSTVCECDEEGCNRSPNRRTISWFIVLLLFLRVLFPP